MFDLEHAIRQWRKQMLVAGMKAPVPLDELESHLRDEIEQKMGSEVHAQKAFEIAVHELGETDALRDEFEKAAPKKTNEKLERRLAVFAATAVFFCSFALFSDDLDLAWRWLGFIHIAIIITAVFRWRQLNRLFPVIADRRIRTAIGLGSFLIGVAGMVVFMNFILPDLALNLGQIKILVLWGLTLMGACSVFAAGLEEAALRQSKNEGKRVRAVPEIMHPGRSQKIACFFRSAASLP